MYHYRYLHRKLLQSFEISHSQKTFMNHFNKNVMRDTFVYFYSDIIDVTLDRVSQYLSFTIGK